MYGEERIHMNLERFKNSPSGRILKVGQDELACRAFVPHPLPPSLTLDAKLVFTLSEADLTAIFLNFNGWTFWHLERSPDDWFILNELRK